MNIGIASDHGGYKLKDKLIKYLKQKGCNVIDYGTDSTNSCDYPDYAYKLCKGILNNEAELGIAICKTGIGISIACNKIKGIRCAKVSNSKEAKMSKLHNNANVIALSGEMLTFEAKDIIDEFITNKFSNEERHINRINKITKLEEDNEL